jgi:hypothetical protein
MLVEKTHLFITKQEINWILELFKSKFKMLGFPNSIDTSNIMNYILVRGMPMNLEYSYRQIIEFMKKNNENCAIVLPESTYSDSGKSYIDKYLIQHEENLFLSPVIGFNAKLEFKEMLECAGLNSLLHFWSDNYFLFSETLDWVIQYLEHRNMYLFFFTNPSQLEGCSLLEDIMYDYDTILENSSDGWNDKEEQVLKEYWLPNQYKFDMK